VARTVESRQSKVEGFLNRAGRHLGRMASIKTVSSTHLTFLESGGSLKQIFRTNGFTPRDVRSFSVDLQAHLFDREGSEPHKQLLVEVNADEPLIWMGGRTNKLALNINLNEALEAERNHIEAFVGERFTHVPRLKAFDPHITIGAIDSRIIDAEARGNPGLLLPEDLHIPRHIALNGLMVYLNDIADR
jgi:hypothetical protein